MEHKIVSSTKSRLGCSVCLKNKPVVKQKLKSSGNQNNERKDFITVSNKNEITYSFETNKSTPSIKKKVSECYCNHMQPVHIDPSPKLVCSKQFNETNLSHMDKGWLEDLRDFRHRNWFDCHANPYSVAIDLVGLNGNYTLSNLNEYGCIPKKTGHKYCDSICLNCFNSEIDCRTCKLNYKHDEEKNGQKK